MPTYKKRFSGQERLRGYRSAAGKAAGATGQAPGITRVNPLLDPGAQARQMQQIGADTLLHQQIKTQDAGEARAERRVGLAETTQLGGLDIAKRGMTERETAGRSGRGITERVTGLRETESAQAVKIRAEQARQGRVKFGQEFDPATTPTVGLRPETTVMNAPAPTGVLPSVSGMGQPQTDPTVTFLGPQGAAPAQPGPVGVSAGGIGVQSTSQAQGAQTGLSPFEQKAAAGLAEQEARTVGLAGRERRADAATKLAQEKQDIALAQDATPETFRDYLKNRDPSVLKMRKKGGGFAPVTGPEGALYAINKDTGHYEKMVDAPAEVTKGMSAKEKADYNVKRAQMIQKEIGALMSDKKFKGWPYKKQLEVAELGVDRMLGQQKAGLAQPSPAPQPAAPQPQPSAGLQPQTDEAKHQRLVQLAQGGDPDAQAFLNRQGIKWQNVGPTQKPERKGARWW